MKFSEEQTLYIIGNGFDLHHGMDTSYLSFAKFMKLKYEKVYDLFIEHFGLTQIDQNTKWDPLWAIFEEVLGQIHADEFLEKFAEHAANPGAPDFSDGDWDTTAVLIQQEIDELLNGMDLAFKLFIENVNYPKCVFFKKLQINDKAIFLNFNYTHSLEKYYGVSRNNIKYIHNRAKENNKLLLGHGVKSPNPFPEELPPIGASEEELEMWNDNMSENYHLSIERGKWQIENYYSRSLKNVSKVIEDNLDFFKQLKKVKNIIVIGHSISEVDHPYFKVILENIDIKSVNWTISFYNDSSKQKLQNELSKIKIPTDKTSYIQIGQLKKYKLFK